MQSKTLLQISLTFIIVFITQLQFIYPAETIEIKMVDLSITTFADIPCDEFNITFQKRIKSITLNKSEEISQFYTLLHNLQRRIELEKIPENVYLEEPEPKIPFRRDTQSNTVEIKYTANDLIDTRGQIIIDKKEIICFNALVVLWNQKMYEMSPELLTFINKHMNNAKKNKKSKKK